MAGSSQPTVEVYARPGCPFCMLLRLELKAAGIAYDETDIWSDPQAAARVRGVAGGNETVPTVFIGDRSLVNPSLGAVKRAIAAASA